MAIEVGSTQPGVDQDATQAPPHVGDFFDLVRRLESGARSRVGTSDPVGGEAVRFASSPSLAFPTHDVERVAEETSPAGERRTRLTVTFLGLLGSVSPLPPEYSLEVLVDKDEGGQSAVGDFLDVFHHRAVSLYYRAWAKHRPELEVDADAKNEATRLLLALGGLDAEAPSADAQDLRRRMPLVGFLARRVRSGAELEAALSLALGDLPVEVVPCVPRTVPIDPDEQMRLGQSRVGLGTDSVLGAEVPDLSGRFRLRIGPLRLDTFERMRPGTIEWRTLLEGVQLSAPQGLEFEVDAILDERDAPEWTLGADRGLGRSCWLGRPTEPDCTKRYGAETTQRVPAEEFAAPVLPPLLMD